MQETNPSLEPLDFTEALKDSPRFRWCLGQHESYLALLENKLKEILKQCHYVVEHGKAYVSSFYAMLEAMSDMNGTCFKTDSTVFSAIEKITNSFEEVAKLQKILIEQAHWSIVKNINDFNKRELNKAQEMRIHFLRVGQSLDEALVKNAQISKHKEQESFEIRNELTAVGTCFAHTALDYVFQIGMVQSRKRYEILEAFTSFLHACHTYFHQGSQLFGTNWEPVKEQLDETHTTLKQNTKQVERKMQDRHMLVPREVFQHPAGISLDPDVVMEGYLFKRASNAFKTWNRRWFVIRDNKLLYCHRDNDASFLHDKTHMTEDGYTVMEVDLRLCLVRPAPNNVERRYCFELVTPAKNHLLQADSESLCNAWIKALQRSIESALYDSVLSERALDDRYAGGDHTASNSISDIETTQVTDSPTVAKAITTSGGVVVTGAPPSKNHTGNSSGSATPQKKRRILDEIISIPGNETCADCGATDPRWASINLGITLCIECGASHRSLGVQVSKVRSLTLDAWEPEQVKLMMLLGNQKVNSAYLANLSPSLSVPPPAKANSSRAARDAWIKAKYLDRQFVFPKSHEAAKTNSEGAPVRFRKQKLPSWRFSISRKFNVNSSGASSEPKEKPAKGFRSSRAKSVAQDPLPAAIRHSVKIPTKLISSRQFCSSPNLRKSDDGATEIMDTTIVNEGDLASPFYGSETLLNEASEMNDGDTNDSRQLMENRRLLAAARLADLRVMSESLARGADVNYAEVDDPDHTTPLHAAIVSGSVEACEYLLLNGAKINIQDSRGRTPLHLACELGNTAQVCLLLKRGASQELSTIAGESALDISMDLTNADIVTLLRLAKLNEEIKETEFGNGGDDTFVEVVRDISLMASNRPQMLRRQQVPPDSDSTQ